MKPAISPLREMAIALFVAIMPGCTFFTVPQADAPPSPAAVPPPSAPATTVIPSPPPSPLPSDLWERGLGLAVSATNLAASAQSRDDWTLVTNRWQQAIALLQRIPASDARHAEAQRHLVEFRRNLAIAQQRAASPIPNVVLTAPVVSPSPSASPSPGAPSPAPGAARAIALAAHLREIGAILYTSPDCSDCQQQQALFGEAAVSRLNIVECSPAGGPATPEPCRQAAITTYPTWEISGQFYQGMQPLERLAELSNYQEPAQR